MYMNAATPIEPIPWQPYMGLGTCDSVNATNNDNAAEIAADSAAVKATSPSNNGCAAGTTSDTPQTHLSLLTMPSTACLATLIALIHRHNPLICPAQ